jgi:hypothetical protein
MIVSGHKPNGLNPIRSIKTSSLSIGQVGSSFQKHRYYYDCKDKKPLTEELDFKIKDAPSF